MIRSHNLWVEHGAGGVFLKSWLFLFKYYISHTRPSCAFVDFLLFVADVFEMKLNNRDCLQSGMGRYISFGVLE